MQKIRIPIELGVVKNVDPFNLSRGGVVLVGFSGRLDSNQTSGINKGPYNDDKINLITDELGGLALRPGLTQFCDLGTAYPIDALWWWERLDYALALSKNQLWKITSSSGTFAEIPNGDAGQTFDAGTPASFVEFGAYAYAVNGDPADNQKIKKIGPSSYTNLTSTDAPIGASKLAYLDKYLLALHPQNDVIYYSAVGDADTWAGDYFEAESLGDKTKYIGTTGDELYCIGESTIEVWHDDGVTPFSKFLQGRIDSGTRSPHSVAYCEVVGSFVYMDTHKRVVMINGRSVVPLSTSVDRSFQTYTVTDARGFYIPMFGRAYYLITFPTSAKTWVYDFLSDQWYEWTYYNTGTPAHELFRGIAFCYCPAWNVCLVGDKSNGKIYKFDNTVFQDGSDAIYWLYRTGHVDHGQQVRSARLDLRAKRTSSTSALNFSMRYRNDGERTYTSYKTKDLAVASSSNADSYISWRRLGRYKSRQWELSGHANASLSITGITETVE